MTLPTLTFEAAFGVNPGDIPKLHLRLPGESGDYASTPDSAALDITSDIELSAVVSTEDWASGGDQTLVAKAGTDFSYQLGLTSDGFALLRLHDGSVLDSTRSSVAVDFAPFARHGIRVTWRASDNRVQFFTSDDEGATWAQLGTDRGTTVTSIQAGTADLTLGTRSTAPLDLFEGRIYSAKVISDPFGTPVEEANPDFTDTVEWTAGDTTGSDDAGNTWTINQSGDPVAEIRDDWEDISSRLRSETQEGGTLGITWQRGRNTELDRNDAATATVLLDNRDRELDPLNTASTYAGQLVPAVRCRLRANWQTVDYDLWEMFTSDWPGYFGRFDAVVSLELVDGFQALSTARTSAAYSSEATGTRIGNLLDAAGWPATKRDLDAGQSDVQAYAASDRIVLNAIRDTAETESGSFWIDTGGDAVFRDRLSRITSSSQETFGPNNVRYTDITIKPQSDNQLWNDIAVKPDGLTVQRATDQTSVARYFRRSLPEFGTLITTELEADDAANWTLKRYKDPRTRITSLVIQGHKGTSQQTQVLAREIGDRIMVEADHPGGGATITEEVFIEKESHEVKAMTWTTSWMLSPAFAESVWLIGLTGFSEVGETTFVGYTAIVPPTPWLVRLMDRFDEWLEGLWNR